MTVTGEKKTEAQQLEFDVRRNAVIAKARKRWRRRVLSRPIPGWWTTITRGDDGWR